MWIKTVIVLGVVAEVLGHGALVSPRSRNSVDYLVGVNTARCSNITGDKCENGQASFWCVLGASARRWPLADLARPRYSQGCFIGCPTCDNMSGRRQVCPPPLLFNHPTED